MRTFISNKNISSIIFILFFLIYIVLCFRIMLSSPLMEFDGANRAEGAKQMKLHYEFLAPLTGSPYLRDNDLKLQIQENPPKYLYYHLERPPLVYWFMILSTNIFGNREFAYRLPSFLFGILIFPIFYFGIKKLDSTYNSTALCISLLCLITSYDWWSSSQMALLDTALSTFLFLSFFFILFFQKYKKKSYLIWSGVFLGLAILSKGQPAAIILIPLLVMVLLKQIKIKQAGLMLFTAFFTISPWLFLSIYKFGVSNVVNIFIFNFAISRISDPTETQQAPFYWYIRWLVDTFRPGFIIFLLCTYFDFFCKSINKSKIITFSYIFGGLLLYSFAANKVWWYILPLIPMMCLYIYLSLAFLLEKKKITLFQLTVFILLGSLPLFYKERNIVAIMFESILLFLSILFYYSLKRIRKIPPLFNIIVFLSLTFFLFHFPKLAPIYNETRDISYVFRDIPGKKCLFVYNIPYESTLFYSNAGEINTFDPKQKISNKCKNYIITSDTLDKYTLLYQKEKLKLYKITQ